MSPTLPQALVPLRAWLDLNHPGTVMIGLVLMTSTGQQQTLPLPAPATVPAETPEEFVPFHPTAFQQAILRALEGKALRKQALGAAVGDVGRLYRPHGLPELRERGLVVHSDRVGFYRPDSPPAGLANDHNDDDQ
jgi:hypothetical protein